MRNFYFLLAILIVSISCKQKDNSELVTEDSSNSNVKYATGFELIKQNGIQTIVVKNPWPGADKSFTYALLAEGDNVDEGINYDAVVRVPLSNIVVTSTTHIPSLEMLGVLDKLNGFPNLNYISSEKARDLIDSGDIKELGKNEDINTEVLINLQPQALVTFAVEGGNKSVSTVERTGIPVLYNADWTETTPLGKAEWIKFFGVLFQKEKVADSIFSEIEKNYINAKKAASVAKKRPTVLSGAMYKDVWYLPQGDSWAARFIEDANGDYLWRETEGTGSISLNLESVLEKGEKAEVWVGPGQFTSLKQMMEAHNVYTKFEAFNSGEVYSFTNRKGATGGVIYYELAPNRPDLVLKDIIKILHPEILPDHELFFFSKLD